ncbi:MAG: histidinol dehydrogenase [Pseudomonadota bacterium]
MARRLNTTQSDFTAAFDALLNQSRGTVEDVRADVEVIIAGVRNGGFSALSKYTDQFDNFQLSPGNARVSEAEFAEAESACEDAALEALDFAAQRITAFHQKQLPVDVRYTDEAGVELGWQWTSVDAAGLYVPGGRAAYPSSVLMNAIAAKTAGVSRLAMTTPATGGDINPLVLAAARRAGVDEVWKIGGAQAVAALAFGADPIAPTDVIVGPGNAYVAEAKRQVFGIVGIDSIAGPSEILVVADADNDADWIAADLLSQAEHDPSSQSILITDDDDFADAVSDAAASQIGESPRKEITNAAWSQNGAIIVVDKLDMAPALVNQIAPEHLELATADPNALMIKIKHAGAIFLGRHTPEAIGDYVAGPNHVLPTSRAARYASGLSVLNFMKRSTIMRCDAAALNAVGPTAARLADAEGLTSHAHSIRVRLK